MNGLFVTGSFSNIVLKALDCRLLNPSGCSFSACSCIEMGRVLFSPLTFRGDGVTPAGREAVGIWDLNGDFVTRLFFLTALKLDDCLRATPEVPRPGESRFAILRGVVAGDRQSLFGSCGEFECKRSRRGVAEFIVNNGGGKGWRGGRGKVKGESKPESDTVRSSFQQRAST